MGWYGGNDCGCCDPCTSTSYDSTYTDLFPGPTLNAKWALGSLATAIVSNQLQIEYNPSSLSLGHIGYLTKSPSPSGSSDRDIYVEVDAVDLPTGFGTDGSSYFAAKAVGFRGAFLHTTGSHLDFGIIDDESGTTEYYLNKTSNTSGTGITRLGGTPSAGDTLRIELVFTSDLNYGITCKANGSTIHTENETLDTSNEFNYSLCRIETAITVHHSSVINIGFGNMTLFDNWDQGFA